MGDRIAFASLFGGKRADTRAVPEIAGQGIGFALYIENRIAKKE